MDENARAELVARAAARGRRAEALNYFAERGDAPELTDNEPYVRKEPQVMNLCVECGANPVSTPGAECADCKRQDEEQ